MNLRYLTYNQIRTLKTIAVHTSVHVDGAHRVEVLCEGKIVIMHQLLSVSCLLYNNCLC